MRWPRKQKSGTGDDGTAACYTTDPKVEQPGDKTHEAPEETHQDAEYPGLKIVLPTVFSVCLTVFLTSLDRTIIGVAVPAISNEFNSFADISWYEAAYLLTFCTLQLPMGKIYTYFPAKWTFIVVVFIFELGSLICAAAPNSTAFIIGRAIAGIGSAGNITGGNVIFAGILPLEKRPKYLGFIGATFGLASILGPLLGGVFTTNLTWRWCFWINLPIGGLALAGLLFILPTQKAPQQHSGEPLSKRLRRFDPIGTAIITPALIILLLALQWGSERGSWSGARVVACLVIGIALILVFAAIQPFLGEDAMLPVRIIRKRSIWSGALVSFGFGSVLIVVTFYLPIWYQAIRGDTAQKAGIRLIPYFISTVVFVIAGGAAVSKVGCYTPFLIAGTALMIVGSGLLSTFRPSTTEAMSAGYQVLLGAGLGLALPQAQTAAQTVLAHEDIAIGLTIINFSNFLGGTILVSVCQSILSQTLKSRLQQSLPGFDVTSLSTSGATDLTKLVPSGQVHLLQEAYNEGIVNIFYCTLALSCFAFISALFLEWKTVKKTPEAATVA